jgi:acetyl-CoA carboxylase carboxyltransferase component
VTTQNAEEQVRQGVSDTATSEPSWATEADQIARGRDAALAMGGEQRLKQQHDRGKLSVRERVDLLFDEGTFEELGILADAAPNGEYAAADGLVVGHGQIDGRLAFVVANDFTVMGGSDGKIGRRKRLRVFELALRMRCPVVYLIDGAGARAQEAVGDEWPSGPELIAMLKLSGLVPQVAAVLGPAAGGPALWPPLSDFRIMVRGTGMLAAGGPPVVESATGSRPSKEELGGWEVHGLKSGLIHHGVDSDDEAIAVVRRYLSYMPSSCWAPPPSVGTDDDPYRRDEELLSVVPRQRRRAYDVRTIIKHVVDRDSFFEIQSTFARALVVGFGRFHGRVVGIQANQPMVRAGALGAAEANKSAHFLEVCNSFNIPLLFLTDIPGMMVGRDAEVSGVLQAGVRAAFVMARMRVPTISILIRKAYGMGSVAMLGPGNGQLGTFAWPSAEFGGLPLEGGVNAAYRSRIEQSEDQEGSRADLRREFAARTIGVIQAAKRFDFDDLLDPRETRERIVRLLQRAPEVEPGPWMRSGITP